MAPAALTVYHDGSCPLCRLEIGQYQRERGSERIDFVDVAQPSANPGSDLPRSDAMRRFHVRLPSGELKSGAAAFLEVWKTLPRWHYVAAIARLPGALPVLEAGYRAFLPLRPALARMIGRLAKA